MALPSMPAFTNKRSLAALLPLAVLFVWGPSPATANYQYDFGLRDGDHYCGESQVDVSWLEEGQTGLERPGFNCTQIGRELRCLRMCPHDYECCDGFCVSMASRHNCGGGCQTTPVCRIADQDCCTYEDPSTQFGCIDIHKDTHCMSCGDNCTAAGHTCCPLDPLHLNNWGCVNIQFDDVHCGGCAYGQGTPTDANYVRLIPPDEGCCDGIKYNKLAHSCCHIDGVGWQVINTQDSDEHCGACHHHCDGMKTGVGVDLLEKCCNGQCKDLTSDPNHCDSCNNACDPTAPLCCSRASGGVTLGGICVDPDTGYEPNAPDMTVAHCGMCDRYVNNRAIGACCSGDPVNDLSADENHCGVCGNACSSGCCTGGMCC